MILEDSDGKSIEPVNEGDLENVISNVGGSLDFCTLTDGDDFIQTAGSDRGFFLQYRDSSGMYESSDASLSADRVKEVFSAYLKGDGSWKDGISFSLMDENFDQAGSDDPVRDARLNSGPKDFSPESIKDTVVKAVKSEASRGVSSMIRRVIRNIFR